VGCTGMRFLLSWSGLSLEQVSSSIAQEHRGVLAEMNRLGLRLASALLPKVGPGTATSNDPAQCPCNGHLGNLIAAGFATRTLSST
jgi:hypothetical protein